jgi:hypothetical protein
LKKAIQPAKHAKKKEFVGSIKSSANAVAADANTTSSKQTEVVVQAIFGCFPKPKLGLRGSAAPPNYRKQF